MEVLAASKMFVAGVFAGTMEAASTTPIETVKVRIQNAATQAAKGSVPQNLGFVSVFTSIAAKEGPLALYRGAGPRVVNGAVAASVLFGVNGELKRLFGAREGQPLEAPFLAAAFCTGVSEAMIYCPIEVVRTRLQAIPAGAAPAGGALALTSSILRTDGVRGLYRGFVPMVPKEALGNVAYFTTYELVRALLGGRGATGKGRGRENLEIMFAGGCAGGMYGLAIHPLDTVKTVIQSESGTSRYRGTIHCLQDIMARGGGIAGLYAGLGPAVVRAFMANAVTFLTLEFAVDEIDGFIESQRQPAVQRR